MTETQTAARRTTVPRQARAHRTRDALLAAAERIVASEGAGAVTTTRIAAETGVAVGTIYRYFADREALLLAAYDGTVARIVDICAEALQSVDRDLPVEEAARLLLELYLDTAESIPAHARLLAAMRAIRPIEADQAGDNEVTISDNLLTPFLERFAAGASADPARLHFMNVLLSALVDLYLMTPDPVERAHLREEIEAHMLLALKRMLHE